MKNCRAVSTIGTPSVTLTLLPPCLPPNSGRTYFTFSALSRRSLLNPWAPRGKQGSTSHLSSVNKTTFVVSESVGAAGFSSTSSSSSSPPSNLLSISSPDSLSLPSSELPPSGVSSLSSTSSLGRLLGLLALSPPPLFLDLEDAAAFGFSLWSPDFSGHFVLLCPSFLQTEQVVTFFGLASVGCWTGAGGASEGVGVSYDKNF